jgi:hypothetical protein
MIDRRSSMIARMTPLEPSIWVVLANRASCDDLHTVFGTRGAASWWALARAAVAFARDRGARAIEAYPIIPENVIAEELHVGTPSVFADAGLVEVGRPTPRRLVMRLEF